VKQSAINYDRRAGAIDNFGRGTIWGLVNLPLVLKCEFIRLVVINGKVNITFVWVLSGKLSPAEILIIRFRRIHFEKRIFD